MTGRPEAPAATAVVTGASSGIGRAVAERLVATGWRVVGLDRAAGALPQTAVYQHRIVDLADVAQAEDAAAALAGGGCTALVHAAGIMRDDADAATRRTAGAALWQLHVGAAAALAAGLAPGMPDGRGRIVFLSSRAADGRAGRALYAASKSALAGLARSLAAGLVRRGITVNVVAPAAVDTPQLRDPARAAAAVRLPPLGRLIAPSEVAATVAFLLEPEAGAITGQTVYQCGGASLAGALPAAASLERAEDEA
ncbi:SDR family oxidoreductase [Aquibium sp. A9E412]|uniref:SDR family NAD(P)-dependent oxidoreductase n=1 Tax=Aquibium sp. A9E412 TaxID=2976767 RepID=UPI0025AFB7CF|nr:SDR family oxidoreductase [Aquibium sp. A9E412]MDN2566531.1 SDR family oxidoreductase [Aquibium sp. A9E412]